MKIPFSLISKTTGEYVSGQRSNIVITISVDGGAVSTQAVSSSNLVEVDSSTAPGWYVFTLSDTTCTAYILVQISCTGCIARRFTLRPEFDPSTLASKTDVSNAQSALESSLSSLSSSSGSDGTYSGPSASSIASAVLNEPLSAHTVAGTVGATLSGCATSSQLSALQSHGDQSWSPSSVSVPTASEIASAVWSNSSATALSSSVSALSTDVGIVKTRAVPTASEIASAVWSNSSATALSSSVSALSTDVGIVKTRAVPTASEIASSLMSTNVASISVPSNGYTLKHLIMASQRSRVVSSGASTCWEILDSNDSVIATRTLTLNSKGAIVKTE